MRHVLVLSLVFLVCASFLACGTDTSITPTGPSSDLTSMSAAEATLKTPQVLPVGSTPHGKSYEEWSVEWWRWLWSAPPASNPGLDETGDNITYGQSGRVWFLAPNYGWTSERWATIPTGTTLFIDIAAYFFSPQIGDPSDPDELIAAAVAAADGITNPRLTIDGMDVPNMEDFRILSDLFSYELPEDNMFTLFGIPTPAGTYYPAVSDGYFVMIPPLSAGEHTIVIHGEFPDSISDVTIHLTVDGRARGKKRGMAE